MSDETRRNSVPAWTEEQWAEQRAGLSAAPGAYHRWYYYHGIWERVTWRGVPTLKSVCDLWNYQEIIAALRPALIVEFGTRHGGSALYFADVGRLCNPACRVFSVDVTHAGVLGGVEEHPAIELHAASSTDASTLRRIAALRAECPGPVFAILDSDHRKAHVLAEMIALRELLAGGDYLVVEDGNINGHPVLPGWGEGPAEALAEYKRRHPDDYDEDREREAKFGFTFAPGGFLRRR